jgi:hypothetical protein
MVSCSGSVSMKSFNRLFRRSMTFNAYCNICFIEPRTALRNRDADSMTNVLPSERDWRAESPPDETIYGTSREARLTPTWMAFPPIWLRTYTPISLPT